MIWIDWPPKSAFLIASLILAGCAGSVLNPHILPAPPSSGNSGSRQEGAGHTGDSSNGDPPPTHTYALILKDKQEVLLRERARAEHLIQAYQAAVRNQSGTPAAIPGAMPIGAGCVGWRAATHGIENSSPLLAAIAVMGSAFAFNKVTYSEPRIQSYWAGIDALVQLRDAYA